MDRLIARRLSLLGGGLLLAAGLPAEVAAQRAGRPASPATAVPDALRPIRLGQLVEATLASTDPKIESRGPFHTYRFVAKADTRYIITMRSESVDAYVWVARAVGPLTENLDSDDDSGGDTDARLRFRATEAGTYIIVAQSLSENGAGAYTLMLEEAPAPQPAVARSITVGETLTGTIDESSPLLEEMDDIPYALFSLSARGGKRIRITLTADDFDAYLSVLRVTSGGEEEVASNDDSGGGTNARVTFAADGEYKIIARPLGAGGAGPYSIAVSEAPASVVITRAIRVGDTAEGEITDSDPEMDEGPYYHQFEIQAQEGDRVRITLRSESFDSFLRWGRAGEEGFEELGSDDDSGGNVDSMLEITVPASGKYLIRVSPLGAGQTGSYRLLVERP
jgi:hypothetical protein